MKIYTRTGDAGTTSLVGGKRVSKNSPRLEAYGTIDELNSFIGLLLTHEELTADDTATLTMVQNKLFDAGAYLATDTEGQVATAVEGLDVYQLRVLEQQIDALTANLPELHNFILPGGCRAAAVAGMCRTVCRRAERRVVALAESVPIDTSVQRFLNRLSDYLFTLGRALNRRANHPETAWQK